MKEIRKILIALFFLLSALKGGIAQEDNLSERNDTSIFKRKESLTIVGPDSIDYFLSKPEKIPPILKKVLPDVEFYYSTAALTNTSPRLMGKYKGQDYNPLLSFNFLIDRMSYNQTITQEDKFYALLTIKEGLSSNIQIINISEYSQKVHPRLPLFNLKIETLINGKPKVFFLFLLNNRIHFLATEKEGKYSTLELESLPLNFN